MEKIRFPRRGYKEDLPMLNFCELGYCTDTNELYVGSPNGNVLLEGECFQSIKDIMFKMYGGEKKKSVEEEVKKPEKDGFWKRLFS